MKIQEIIDIKSMVMEKLDNEPENAFDFFKEKWKKLTFNDKEIAEMHIRQSCLNILQIPNSSFLWWIQNSNEFECRILTTGSI